MDENLIINNIENQENEINSDENNYKNLITRLKQIRVNIELLEKIISR